jgi:hypothetical protein
MTKYTEELKSVSTMEELELFLSKLEALELGLKKKRGTWHSGKSFAYAFTEIKPGRVHYLYDDGYTFGESNINNLHKVLTIGRTSIVAFDIANN